MGKYKVIKSVRFRGRDLKVGEIIELLKGSDDYINLMQVDAVVPAEESELKAEAVKEAKNKK